MLHSAASQVILQEIDIISLPSGLLGASGQTQASGSLFLCTAKANFARGGQTLSGPPLLGSPAANIIDIRVDNSPREKLSKICATLWKDGGGMKFVRYGDRGAELPGLVDAKGGIRALSPLVEDITVEMFTPQWQSALAAVDPQKLPLVEGGPRLGVPVDGIRQIIAIGLNYRDHAEESNMAVPDYPVVFAKSIASLSGSTDPIVIPAGTEKLDWEIELGLLIGKPAKHVSVAEALDYVAGYCSVIDVSERCWQFERGGQLGKGKSYDSFTPIGPWMVTADEIADPQALDLWLDVNGTARQRGSTAKMIFTAAEIIAHLSTYQKLLPGDLVITGTPAGVAFGMKSPAYLRPGDEMRCGVSGLGDQHHVVQLDQ